MSASPYTAMVGFCVFFLVACCDAGTAPCEIDGVVYLHEELTPDPCHRCYCFNAEEICNPRICPTVSDCKFPKEMRGIWNYTYSLATTFEFWQRTATLKLLSGERIRFVCDQQDDGIFVMRARGYVSQLEDAIMCMEFSVVEGDPFFNFQLSRLNSGDVQDGRLRSVVRYRPVDIHVDCDWLDSPAIPEFLYRADGRQL